MGSGAPPAVQRLQQAWPPMALKWLNTLDARPCLPLPHSLRLVAGRLAEPQAWEPAVEGVWVGWREAGCQSCGRQRCRPGCRQLRAATFEVGAYLGLAPAGRFDREGKARSGELATVPPAPPHLPPQPGGQAAPHHVRASNGGSGTSRPSSSASSCSTYRARRAGRWRGRGRGRRLVNMPMSIEVCLKL